MILLHDPNGTLIHYLGPLFVAFGEQLCTNAPLPERIEPWMRGVQWKTEKSFMFKVEDGKTMGIPFLLVDGPNKTIPRGFRRIDILRLHSALPGQTSLSKVILVTYSVHIQRVAMAVLRCCVETERAGTYMPDQVDLLGDAMMLQ